MVYSIRKVLYTLYVDTFKYNYQVYRLGSCELFALNTMVMVMVIIINLIARRFKLTPRRALHVVHQGTTMN